MNWGRKITCRELERKGERESETEREGERSKWVTRENRIYRIVPKALTLRRLTLH